MTRGLNGRLILVVQQNWQIARALTSALEKKSAQVVMTRVPPHELADLPHLAAAVLDGQSHELCQRLEARGTPCVVYTARDVSEDQFTRAAVVQKPAPATEVVAAVEQLLLTWESLIWPSPE